METTTTYSWVGPFPRESAPMWAVRLFDLDKVASEKQGGQLCSSVSRTDDVDQKGSTGPLNPNGFRDLV